MVRRDLGTLTIAPDADALDALGKMQRGGVSRLLVTEGGRLVGIVSLKDLLGFLNLKLEREVPAEEAPEVLSSPVEGNGRAPALYR